MEPFGQRFPHSLFDHAPTCEADARARFRHVDIAQHRKACRDTARRWVGQHNDIGQSGFFHFLNRNGRAGKLHQGQETFLHPRPTRGRNRNQRGLLHHGQTGCRQHAFAHRHAHGPAHEVKIERGDNHLLTQQFAMGNNDRIAAIGFRLGILQPVGIALFIAEFQRVNLHPGQLNTGIIRIIKQMIQPLCQGQTQVIAAMLTDMQMAFQIPMKDHLSTAWTFMP